MDPSNIPVVDLRSLFTGDETTKHRIAHEIDLAFQNVGFLVISGHGVNESTILNCANSVKSYFDLPTKDKMDYLHDGLNNTQMVISVFYLPYTIRHKLKAPNRDN